MAGQNREDALLPGMSSVKMETSALPINPVPMQRMNDARFDPVVPAARLHAP
jgi:hypothetical protein